MKRWTLQIVACLILGAVTTIAIIVAASRWDRPRFCTLCLVDAAAGVWVSPPVTFPSRGFGYVERREDAAELMRIALAAAEAVDTARFEVSDWSPIIYRGAASDWTFGHARQIDFRRADPGNTRAGLVRVDVLAHQSGWPFRAMERVVCDEVASSDMTNQVTALRTTMDGVFSGSIAKLTAKERGLYRPQRIIWHGFALDALLFAAAWFLALFGFAAAFQAARRVVRDARGRCPQCGYDLRGQMQSGCPECGWRRIESSEHQS